MIYWDGDGEGEEEELEEEEEEEEGKEEDWWLLDCMTNNTWHYTIKKRFLSLPKAKSAVIFFGI
jgi:hypothetical protein